MINEKNTAIVLNEGHYATKYIQQRGFTVYRHLKSTNPLTRRLLNFCRNHSFLSRIERLFFEDAINEENFDNYIVYDARASVEYLRWLRENHPKARIILFYDNPVANTEVNVNMLNDEICERWSFDFEDCEKYGLHYNSEFYFEELRCVEHPIKYDIMFLGKDKGRYDRLVELEKKFTDIGLTMYLHIVPDSKFSAKKRDRYRAGVSYPQLLEIVSESKVLLDILQDDQVGLTLRNMEAVFNGKKQITDNPAIRKYNFYSRENVFILGEDDFSKIGEFVRTPSLGYDMEIVNYYTFDEWIKRFDN